MSRALPPDAATLDQITTTGLIAAEPSDRAAPSDDDDPADSSTAADSDDPRYEARNVLGRGGMGEVRLCKDLHIGREVARKRILPDLANNAEVRLRFIREAQIQGQLEHPGTVPVYDLVADPSGGVFFTMKRLRGRTLEDILDGLRQGRAEDLATYSRHRLLQSFAAICLTMDYAHSRGIVHRDLKPSNIMLGDFGEVHVLDWGVAKVLSDGAESAAEPASVAVVAVTPSASAPHTEVGRLSGTLLYMSPEQARGRTEAVDARSDVFTLGVILFELLTYERLRSPRLPHEMLMAIHAGDNARPSERAPQREVPPELEAICVRATQLDPKARYESARKLHAAIEQYLAGERDVELRHAAATGHVAAASDAVEHALSGDKGAETSRRTALFEVGRALALEPSNSAALRLLSRILTEPPKELPQEVQAELAADRLQRENLRLRSLASAGASSLFIIAVLALMGFRDKRMAALVLGLAIAGIAMRIYLAKRQQAPPVWHFVTHFVNLGIFACYARVVGPLLLTPVPLIVHTMLHSLSPHRFQRQLALWSNCGLIVVMTLLEQIGVLSPSVIFEDGIIKILPNMVDFPKLWTMVGFLGAGVLSIFVPARILSKLPVEMREAEKRLALQAWHFRQLVPELERGSSSSLTLRGAPLKNV